MAISQPTKDFNYQLLNCAVVFVKIAFWIVCIVFGFLCLIPTAHFPSGLFDWWDKAQHVFAFFCLSGLSIFAYQKAVVKVVIGLLIYGALIGALQRLTGGRSGEFANWVADEFGILIGCPFINRLIQKYP